MIDRLKENMAASAHYGADVHFVVEWLQREWHTDRGTKLDYCVVDLIAYGPDGEPGPCMLGKYVTGIDAKKEPIGYSIRDGECPSYHARALTRRGAAREVRRRAEEIADEVASALGIPSVEVPSSF